MLDSDTLSELSRGHGVVTARARAYLATHGRLTITAVTVFERLRGYRAAIRRGKPFARQLREFQALAAACIVLPLDARAADRAATIWAGLAPARRSALGDVFIGAIASLHGLALATRNRSDFEAIARVSGVELRLVDWAR